MQHSVDAISRCASAEFSAEQVESLSASAIGLEFSNDGALTAANEGT